MRRGSVNVECTACCSAAAVFSLINESTRTPEISDSDYQALLAMVQHEGYEVDKVKRVPQRWKNNENAHTE